MLPLPKQLDGTLSANLQKQATASSTYVLQTLGVSAVRSGSVISVGHEGVPMNVEEACSGLRMLTIFVALAFAVVLVAEIPIWQRIVIALDSVPIALASNILRIVATGILFTLLPGSQEKLKHFFHDGAGLVMMPLAMVLLFLEYKILTNLFVEDDEDLAQPLASPATASKLTASKLTAPKLATAKLAIAGEGALVGAPLPMRPVAPRPVTPRPATAAQIAAKPLPARPLPAHSLPPKPIPARPLPAKPLPAKQTPQTPLPTASRPTAPLPNGADSSQANASQSNSGTALVGQAVVRSAAIGQTAGRDPNRGCPNADSGQARCPEAAAAGANPVWTVGGQSMTNRAEGNGGWLGRNWNMSNLHIMRRGDGVEKKQQVRLFSAARSVS